MRTNNKSPKNHSAKNEKTFKVKNPGTLDEFLKIALAGSKSTRIKQLLKFRSVSVNGKAVTLAKYLLQAGDDVTVNFSRHAVARTTVECGLKIIFEDRYIIIIDKPPGLLSMASETERERTAYSILTNYAKESTLDKEARVFIVHRLDQGTSGLLIFARSEAVKRQLQGNWKNVVKKYYAVVEGKPIPAEKKLQIYLKESAAKRVYATTEKEGALSITNYKVLKTAGKYSLLEVNIETGHKNQIRVHLADIGHPVVGDKKYYAKTDPIGRLALHSFFLMFTHPVTGKKMQFETGLPQRLKSLMSGK